MKSSVESPFMRFARLFVVLSLIFCFTAPVTTMAVDKKGEKNFKRGMQHEAAQRWEDAVTEFALAVAARPADIEYQLHYRRALFNASQAFMVRGRAFAEREQYVSAYNSFRQSYAYDPVNQLALAEMERVMRLQREKDERENPNAKTPAPNNSNTVARGIPTTPASYTQNGVRTGGTRAAQDPALPALTTEKLRIINYNGDLEGLIKKLAEELSLNVIFDEQLSRSPRQISLNLRDVTTAQALDYIFLTRNLFFQKLGRRTILVADAQKRQQYQQLALRTFFLKNILPEDAQRILQQAFPPQPGRGAISAAQNKATNSITVRDTPENLRVVEELIRSLDKERAAMVFDVQIYEVSHTDLLQLGGQLGDSTSLNNFGRTSPLGIVLDGTNRAISTAAGAAAPVSFAAGFVIPSLTLNAFQDKGNTRLLESTQLHAFDGEDIEQRIGRRVPVQTASAFPFNGTGSTPGQPTTGNVFGGGYPVINYEPTGLTIKFTKPQVFPNPDGDYDVQVQMRIESKDVVGGLTATPTFSERSLTGTARIKNNRTLMLASVARDQQARGRRGVPLLGLIPILGRFISTPTRDDSKSDIVIAITPRVIRAPSITPEDQLARAVGSQGSPLSDSLQAFVQEAERDEQLARANGAPQAQPSTPVFASTAAPTQELAQTATQSTPQISPQPTPQTVAQDSVRNNLAPVATTAVSREAVTLPASIKTVGEDDPRYVPAPRVLLPNASLSGSSNGAAASVPPPPPPSAGQINVVSSDVAAKPAMLDNASPEVTPTRTVEATSAPATLPVAAMSFVPNEQQMRAGERRQVMLMLSTETPINLAIATLRFDPKIVAVRGVTLGNFSAAKDFQPFLSHSINPPGMLLVSLATPLRTPLMQGTGVLFVLEIEALAAGESNLELATDGVHFVTPDKSALAKQITGGRIVVTQ